jgi:hypothetical protein
VGRSARPARPCTTAFESKPADYTVTAMDETGRYDRVEISVR